MSDYLYQTFGKLRFPALTTTIDDALQTTDPARDGLLTFFRDAINAELGAAWTVAVAGARSPDLGASPVSDIYPMLPDPDVLTQRKTTWPALFCDRDLSDQRNTIDDHTLWQKRMTTIWGLHYIMPALGIADRRKFKDIVLNVAGCCALAVRNMRHPQHEDGAFIFDSLGLSTLELLSYQAGQAKFAGSADGPNYLAMTMTLKSTELSDYVAGTESTFTEMTIRAGTGQADGLIPVLVEGMTEAPL